MVFPSTLEGFPRNFLVFLLVDFFIASVDFNFRCCLGYIQFNSHIDMDLSEQVVLEHWFLDVIVLC